MGDPFKTWLAPESGMIPHLVIFIPGFLLPKGLYLSLLRRLGSEDKGQSHWLMSNLLGGVSSSYEQDVLHVVIYHHFPML